MKREIKIGLFAVAMIGSAWAGIRFLKGIDIFSRNVDYYAAYDQINGVQSASPIMMRGVKIGTVTGVSFDPARSEQVVLKFSIKREYQIPTDSDAKIFSNGLMGNKAIEVTYGASHTYLQKGDTLHSSRDPDLMDVAGSELDFFKQKVSVVVADLSRTLNSINTLVNSNAQAINGTLTNLNSISGDLQLLLSSERKNLHGALGNLYQFTDMLGRNSVRMDSIMGGVNQMATQLTEQHFAENLARSMAQIDTLLSRINAGQGTVGQLVNDKELYGSLNQASENLAALLADLKDHPARYVHLSLFGQNPEKAQARAERKAAKQAAKDERDSLNRLKK